MRWLHLCLLVVMAVCAVGAEPGVTMSDGTVLAGEVRVVPGGLLRLHDGANLRDLDPAQVLELRLVPESEVLVRAFAMPEPGKAIRVESGEPYPKREFSVVVGLRDGGSVRGHLYATAVLVAGADEDQRVVLPAKQQGRPGQRLDEVVYPRRIVFSADAPEGVAGGPRHLRLRMPPAGTPALTLLTRDTLAPLGATRTAAGWDIEPPLGAPLYVALRQGATVDATVGASVGVGWPADDAALHARIATASADLHDYWEDRRVVAVRAVGDPLRADVSPDTASPLVDSLMLLVRRAPGTDGPRNPWHVEVWRWRQDTDDAQRWLLSARGELARGLYREDQELPAVTAAAAWWKQTIVDGTIDVGDAPGAAP